MIYRFQSPFGVIDYDWHDGLCHAVLLQQSEENYAQHDDPVSTWLSVYFLGKTLPRPALAKAKTDFQGKLRHGLCAIPSGKVKSYGELSKTLNTAPRALGQALGANPFAILIPCHRVVAAHSLGGFHYGNGWKKNLLTFEGALKP